MAGRPLRRLRNPAPLPSFSVLYAEVQRRVDKLHPDEQHDEVDLELLAEVIFEHQIGYKVDHRLEAPAYDRFYGKDRHLDALTDPESPDGKEYARAYQAASALLDKHHPKRRNPAATIPAKEVIKTAEYMLQRQYPSKQLRFHGSVTVDRADVDLCGPKGLVKGSLGCTVLLTPTQAEVHFDDGMEKTIPYRNHSVVEVGQSIAEAIVAKNKRAQDKYRVV